MIGGSYQLWRDGVEAQPGVEGKTARELWVHGQEVQE